MLDPIHYYSPETTLFPELPARFARTGKLTAEELYLILDWKAPRARTKHLKRLTEEGTFAQAAHAIGRALHRAPDDARRLELLLAPPWGFAWPTATAILTVLYPDRFTVYDVRVCKALGGFHQLGNRRWSPDAWAEYRRFTSAVRAAAPTNLSLREADRWLWGKDKRTTLLKEIGGD